MLLGLFVRHYKTYKGYYFIPFTQNQNHKLSAFIGDNGVGKSSILEALDTFFNGREWVLTKDSKREEAILSPLFLMKKSEIESSYLPQFECISNYLKNVTSSDDPNNKYVAEFFSFRDMIIEKLDEDDLLFSFSKTYDVNDRLFGSFDAKIKRLLSLISGYDESDFRKFCEGVINQYSYTYIPVETSIEEFMKLEQKEFQELMNHDLKDEIKKILSEDKIIPSEGRGHDKTIIKTINDHLRKMSHDIEKSIKKMNPKYSFQQSSGARVNITANHLLDNIMEVFCSKKTFKLGSTPIKNLSAGERKKALIDLAFTFLGNDQEREKKIILAVDEPEASLHISKCYEQFKKLSGISNDFSSSSFSRHTLVWIVTNIR